MFKLQQAMTHCVGKFGCPKNSREVIFENFYQCLVFSKFDDITDYF